MSHIIKYDLGLGAFKRQTSQRLTVELNTNSKTKCKELLSLYFAGRYKKLLFTDAKMFTVEKCFNNQNGRAYLEEPTCATI